MNRTSVTRSGIILRFKVILCLVIISFIGLQAQAINPNKVYISVKSGKNVAREVLEVVNKQTGLIFTYSDEIFKPDYEVLLLRPRLTLKELLNITILERGYDWIILGNNIILKKWISVDERHLDKDTSISVSGIIRDEKGKPIPGATILVKGTKIGTLSNESGHFNLNSIPNNSRLLITSISFLPEELAFSQLKSNIIVTLKGEIRKLDETVVGAYTVTTQRNCVGCGISTISAAEIERKPVTNPLLALQGEVPGVFINQSSGYANSGIVVQIRGLNSLNNGNNPLYVIDGVPYTSYLLPGYSIRNLGTSGKNSSGQETFGNPLAFINPANIESISILKDADATSIYGSRAASGAIIITTKKGKPGVTKIGINMQTGWQNVSKHIDVLNTQQYLAMRHQAKANSNAGILSTDYDLNGTWDTTRSIDWQKELFRTARYSDVQLTASGGNSNTQFLLGGGYHKETSILPSFSNRDELTNQKGSINFNITNASNNGKFHLEASASYMVDNNRVPNVDLTSTAITLIPVAPPLFNGDGAINWAPNSSGKSTWKNPLAFLYARTQFRTNNLISHLQLNYEIIEGLKLKLSSGYTNMQSNELNTIPGIVSPPENRINPYRSASYANGFINSWIVEPQLDYRRNGKIGNYEILVGGTAQQNNSYQQQLFGLGYTSDVSLQDPKAASELSYDATVSSVYKYCALFGLLNYNWKNKYYINLSARRDGSSRFGSNNLFHNFGSIAAAWLFSDESLIKSNFSFFSFGKLRVSYGTTGNDQIGDYQFLTLYNQFSVPVNYQGTVGLVPSGLPNPRFQWESTRKLQLGIDMGFISDRILLNINYYRNRSSNQLVNYRLPIQTGFGGITSNFPALVENSGLEILLSTTNVKHNEFTWTSSFNLTIPNNKLISFSDLDKSNYVNTYAIGKSLSLVKVFQYAGLDSSGLFSYRGADGKILNNPNYNIDRNKWIDLAPKAYGGFQNTFIYKGFQVDILFQFAKQTAQNFRAGSSPGRLFSNAIGNQPVTVLEQGAHSKYLSSYTGLPATAYNSIKSSDFIYSDADYIRLKNVSLSWQMPLSWMQKAHIQSCRLFLHAQNLFTFTNYIGIDPETKTISGLPPLKVLTIGLQANL